MDIYIPYTYLIGWSNHNKFYYGVRYAKNCNPTDLWTKYFTSSKYVKSFRKQYGEPDIIQVRKTFTNSRQAIEWEDKVIVKLKLWLREDFLNKNRSKGFMLSPEIIEKINKCPARAKKISDSKMGKPLSPEHIEKSAIGFKKYWSQLSTDQRKKSPETRRKMSITASKNNPGFSITCYCPKCGKEGQKANISKHHGLNGEKCKWFA
jgi:hypothetical protein